jgi:16S rRNA C1402 (ribose-2'-O) methylase RsmI
MLYFNFWSKRFRLRSTFIFGFSSRNPRTNKRKQAELRFQRRTVTFLEGIYRKTDLLPQMAVDVAATRRIVEDALERALQEGIIGIQQLHAKDTEILRLTEELNALKGQTATKFSGADQAAITALLSAGHFDEALRLKERQVEERKVEVTRLAQDLFEMVQSTNFASIGQKH